MCSELWPLGKVALELSSVTTLLGRVEQLSQAPAHQGVQLSHTSLTLLSCCYTDNFETGRIPALVIPSPQLQLKLGSQPMAFWEILVYSPQKTATAFTPEIYLFIKCSCTVYIWGIKNRSSVLLLILGHELALSKAPPPLLFLNT